MLIKAAGLCVDVVRRWNKIVWTKIVFEWIWKVFSSLISHDLGTHRMSPNPPPVPTNLPPVGGKGDTMYHCCCIITGAQGPWSASSHKGCGVRAPSIHSERERPLVFLRSCDPESNPGHPDDASLFYRLVVICTTSCWFNKWSVLILQESWENRNKKIYIYHLIPNFI